MLVLWLLLGAMPTLAYLLLRHGARLDSRNRAGESVAEALRLVATPGSRQLLAELGQANPAARATPGKR